MKFGKVLKFLMDIFQSKTKLIKESNCIGPIIFEPYISRKVTKRNIHPGFLLKITFLNPQLAVFEMAWKNKCPDYYVKLP